MKPEQRPYAAASAISCKDLRHALEAIKPTDKESYQEAQRRWDAIAKPLGGLGMLEDAICRIAAAQRNADVRLEKRALAIFCADNGVVSEGISQSSSEITTVVANNICAGTTSACRMAQQVSCSVVPVDVGVLSDIEDARLSAHKVAYGTANIAQGPAMDEEQLCRAIEAGIAVAYDLTQKGHMLLAAGEMGIGNTTTSSAVASVLLDRHPAVMTGRGAGLSTEGLRHKVAVIEEAISVNKPDPANTLEVMARLGGFDIAAMCGFYLGAASTGRPVILDGFISGVAALCSVRLCPDASGYLLASHASSEPAAQLVLEELGLAAPIHADMHLGEGTGAVALIPLLDMAAAAYLQCRTFEDSEMAPYETLT